MFVWNEALAEGRKGNPGLLTDYHSHTTRCHHAVGTMEQYVERALALGLEEFGFSDHSPWMIQMPGRPMAMQAAELPLYVADVQALQARYNRDGERPFRVRLGLEMDYVPTRLAQAAAAAAAYPWDYLIGSVHHLGFWAMPDPESATMYDRAAFADVCELYYHEIGEMIDRRFCDIVAHLDVIKRFGYAPAGMILEYVRPLIPRIKAAGMAVEVNTSGMDYPCLEAFPSWDVVEALIKAEVPLMLNSDAHAPEHVARHFEPTLARLKSMGLRELARFEGRRMRMVEVG